MINGISSSKIVKTNIDPSIHKTEDALKLKESCQQFEAILWSKLWKDMKQSAMSISGADKERPYKAVACSGRFYPLTEQQYTELCKILTTRL